MNKANNFLVSEQTIGLAKCWVGLHTLHIYIVSTQRKRFVHQRLYRHMNFFNFPRVYCTRTMHMH